ncbi:MAG: hypothetical protein QOE56_414 [Solirubrobacterales bacterium]|jgi:DNA-binding Lrp family transcriptional regulator|nr:hypothetical protein [Solirubrobacterales bacterium]
MDDAAATMGPAAGDGLFSDDADLLAAIEQRKQAIREKRERKFKEIEAECADALGRLDLAIAALSGEKGKPTPPKATPVSGSPPQRKSRRRRRAPMSTTPAAAKERREASFRYLVEVGRAVAPREVKRDLNLTPSSVQSAMARLVEEGRAVRFGVGNGTRYEAKRGPAAAREAGVSQSHDQGSLAGRILETVEERGYASLDELAQATGCSREEVRRACAALQVEEELKMEQRNGRSVYVREVPA